MPESISTVCMDCQAHVRGPEPALAEQVSHGLCQPCYEKRILEIEATFKQEDES